MEEETNPEATRASVGEDVPSGTAPTSAPGSRSSSPARRQGSVPLASQLPTSRVGKCALDLEYTAASLLVTTRQH